MSGTTRVTGATAILLFLALLCSCAGVDSALTKTRAKVDAAVRVNESVTEMIDGTKTLIGGDTTAADGAIGDSSREAGSSDNSRDAIEDEVEPNVSTGAAAEPAFKPVLDCEPVKGVVGEEIHLTCMVADPSGTPVQGVPVVFSIADALGTRDLGIVKSETSGGASIRYVVQWQFQGRQSSHTLHYWARVEESTRLLPSSVQADVIVTK